ncbi:hypothetical protein AKJ16_DCAP18791 [Drosera capensis]
MEEDERSEPSIASRARESETSWCHPISDHQVPDGKVLKLQEKSHNVTDNIDVNADKLDASSTAKDNSTSFQIGIDQILNRRPKLH